MRLTSRILLIAASLTLCGAGFGKDATRQAWFYKDNTAQRWCSVVTEAGARAASNNDRFSGRETGWLHYHDSIIDSVMIMTQSEDAYTEDTYIFATDLSVKQVVRKGHYVDDPFNTATFRPDAHKRLTMTAPARAALKRSRHETYFFDWPLYGSFREMPFARIIRTKPNIAVTGNCSRH